MAESVQIPLPNTTDVRLLSALIEVLPPEEAWRIAAPRLPEIAGSAPGLLAALMDKADLADPSLAQTLSPWLAANSPWTRSTTGQLALAGWWLRVGRKDEAAALWRELAETEGPHQAEAALAWARIARALGNFDEAGAALRSVAGLGGDFAFRSKAGRLLDRLWAQHPPKGARVVRIALLFSTTAELTAPLLQLAAWRDGLKLELYVAPYGSHRQEILDPNSGLYRFAPEIVIIGTNWRDANLPPFSGEAAEAIAKGVDDVHGLWKQLLSRHPCTIFQHNFDVPWLDSAGNLNSVEPRARGQILREINRVLALERPASVVIVDLEQISGIQGKRSWADAAQWHGSKQHPSAAALPLLVDGYAALIRARLGLAKKVLVLDLDNTLWGGVIGEDGLGKIQIGPPSAIGEAYADFQRYVQELGKRGVLLAVCSKNNLADALQPFERHEGMVLKKDDFAAFVASWDDKPKNVRELARRLNLGLDSFVFADDNPLERWLMRRELPEVAVVQLGADPAGFIEQLQSGRYFEALSLSQEDLTRNASYRANEQREQLQASAGSLEDFLKRLQMRMHHGPVDEPVLERVVQLLGKTNQFNLTTRRHGAAEVKALASASTGWTQYFRLTDGYGDNGIVGVMLAVTPPDDPDAWEIDSFLMSCRVLGRNVEKFMVATLLRAARAAGKKTVRGLFLPTPKNGVAAEVYEKLGFVPEKAAGVPAAARSFRWDIARQGIPLAPFIESHPDAS